MNRGWLWTIALTCACAVDPSGLPADGSVSMECATDAECDDAIECTNDSCTAGGTCAHRLEDALCEPGEACFPGEGCRVSSCSPTECGDALRNDATCLLGACQGDGTCISQEVCAAGESCCGNGTCLDCDDGNPCTADSCNAMGCVHDPLTGNSCDDGDFCTGIETCQAGTCVPSGDPCLDPTVCDVDRCVGCVDRADCPADSNSDWTACDFGGSACAETGTETRIATTYQCVARECQQTNTDESRACTRSTTGDSCRTDVLGGWTPCSGFGSTCGETGSRTRDRTVFTCGGGTCNGATNPESGTCMRTTNGDMCGMTNTTSWSACMGFTDPCDESGTQTRMITTRTCADGTCGMTTITETRACSRVTEGTMCMADDVDATAPCMPEAGDGECALTGLREVMTTRYTCMAGTCAGTTTAEMVACPRATEGLECNAASPCKGACLLGVCDFATSNGDTCDDGRGCTDADVCVGGACQGEDDCGGGDCTGCGGSSCNCQGDGSAAMCGCD